MIVEKTNNNYTTDQNLIVRYPNGAGGKFVITCLFLFDQVAHWDTQVYNNQQSHWDWFQQTWPDNISQWSIREPNHPWSTNFFSRRYNRNNNISVETYNNLVEEHASEHFFTCWRKGLKIVDHFHKKFRPSFQASADIVEINLSTDRSIELYKDIVQKKLWLWNPETKEIISTLDHPDYAHDEVSRLHRLKFNNESTITGFNSYDDFFNQRLSNEEFVKPFLYAEPDSSCILSMNFEDLYQFDALLGRLEVVEKKYNQTLNKDLLKSMHNIWLTKSQISV
jgi:hypothetical protein